MSSLVAFLSWAKRKRNRLSKRQRDLLRWVGLGLLLLTLVTAIWLYFLDRAITARLASGKFAPAVEFYTAPEVLRPGYVLPAQYLENLFRTQRYDERRFGRSLEAREFSVWTGPECVSVLPPFQLESNGVMEPSSLVAARISRCVAFRSTQTPVQIVAFDEDRRTILATFQGAPPALSASVEIDPALFAQYYGDRPILREEVRLSNAPASCLNAIVAIEDADFLEHSGVSLQSMARAALSIAKNWRITQGGSTITQQTVKNFFLTEERTVRRKLTEIAMSILLETRLDKDQIFELYINTIYMGQNGVFEVRGFSAAARHYFNSDLQDLDLAQCALLAAVLNGPGKFDPFRKSEAALKRRNRVLERMRELELAAPEDVEVALKAALPKETRRALTEPAPYFVQTVRRQLRQLGLDESSGLRVVTSLNSRAQESAYLAVRDGLKRLDETNSTVKKHLKDGKHLEAILISADPRTGQVQALVGGRGFKISPFNRAFDSQRQVGSIMKPFVYLAALESKNPETGQEYTPLSLVSDEAFTHKFDKQTWSPRNYDGKFHGDVPMYLALKESLNVATAWLGIRVGLDRVVDVAHAAGIESSMKAFPSLSLGAFELHPWEVLQSYNTLAKGGEKIPLTFVLQVNDLAGVELYRFDPPRSQAFSREATASLVSMMQQTLNTGTARAARLIGFTHPAAGKTGTTNDKKDAWFAGFTPFHSAVAWVGYDDNTTHGLTGASGAVPIWTQYMKSYAQTFPAEEFSIPDGSVRVPISIETQMALGLSADNPDLQVPLSLVFRSNQAPIEPNQSSSPISQPNPFKPAGN